MWRLFVLIAAMAMPAPVSAQQVVTSAAPAEVSVTIYRAPDRDADEAIDLDWLEGYALVTERRLVNIPAGRGVIRFEGVAAGMLPESAIVTGLPDGVREKNLDADLLSPLSLFARSYGRPVTLRRTNGRTGEVREERAIIRSGPDGAAIVQTSEGFEAVDCGPLTDELIYDGVPDGLSAKPTLSIETDAPQGGQVALTLSYLAWGFDWQANYVGTMLEKGDGEGFTMRLLSWLTLLNDNGQSFDKARLQIIAGRLNVVSDFQGLSDPPTAGPLRLTCYPFGSTAAGSPVPDYGPVPPPPPPPPAMYAPAELQAITVTGARMRAEDMGAPAAVVTADEEGLGDLKLFRVPGRVDVSAKGMKQVAFLNKDAVKARFLYQAACDPYAWIGDNDEPQPASVLLVTKNETAKGLGIALPQGPMTLYEPTQRGPQLAGQVSLRDYARGQDIELELANSAQVFSRCAATSDDADPDDGRKWTNMRAELTNANPHPVTLRLQLGRGGEYDIRFPPHKVVVKNGYQTVEVTLPANQSRTIEWKLRNAEAD